MFMRFGWKSVALVLLVAGLAPGAGAPDGGHESDAGETAPHGTGQRIGARAADRLRDAGIPDPLAVAMIATLPIVELRGAIPVGNNYLGMKDRFWVTYLWAVAGNMLPVPFILLLLGPLSRLGMRVPIGRRFFTWLFARTRRKTTAIERYETLGLTLFVAIPLPVTGAWTGAVAAFLMGLTLPHAFGAILLGVLIAGVVVTSLSLLGWLGAAIAGGVLAALVLVSLSRLLRRTPSPRDAVARGPTR